MLTLLAIDRLFPESRFGSLYADVYRDVYGERPQGVRFETMDEFDQKFDKIICLLKDQQAMRIDHQSRNWDIFLGRIHHIQEDATRARSKLKALKILTASEGGTEYYKIYGPEWVEWHLDLKPGSVRQWLLEEE